jgi:ABC-2 type transport system permease protein
MVGSVFLKTLRDLRRGFAWWSLGLVGMVALMDGVYPSIQHVPALDRLVKAYPAALKAFVGFGGEIDYSSAAGYLGIELFSFVVPLLLLVAAIGSGARSIAGEEENGTLEILLAAPLSRRRLVLEKLLALAVELVALGGVLLLSLWVGAHAAGMAIGLGRLAAGTASAVLLALAYGALAVLVGAATGKRGLTTAVVAAAAVAAYLVSSLAQIVSGLSSIKIVSPFYHYAAGDPLRNGLAPSHALVLLGIALVAGSLAPLALGRRDIAVA